jgi:hypothetical protein
MGYDDAQVAFGIVVAHRETTIGIGLSSYRMRHRYIRQRFACFGIDHPALMVMESDILCLAENRRKEDEYYGCSFHRAWE